MNKRGGSYYWLFLFLVLIAGLSILLFGTDGGRYVLLAALALLIAVSILR